ncbi:hypothetical protein QF030_000852 [Streptomyces rishiriensis]|uniref:Uncharacterized protein n=1 Tax=Streptomyces rishiriensis TaxID=68264 RepID=A0ABU0NHW7_STRRH|nr:hypothetical protein [Streptomyces rishiriensis]
MHSLGRDETLGTAYSDHDVMVVLKGAGIRDPDSILDDDRWIEWRGGRALVRRQDRRPQKGDLWEDSVTARISSWRAVSEWPRR